MPENFTRPTANNTQRYGKNLLKTSNTTKETACIQSRRFPFPANTVKNSTVSPNTARQLGPLLHILSAR